MQVFNESLMEWSEQLPEWLSESLIDLIRQCGTPSYTERGSKKTINLSTPNLGTDRFVSELDRLAFKAIIEAKKAATSSDSAKANYEHI
jgi:hypothetical protein